MRRRLWWIVGAAVVVLAAVSFLTAIVFLASGASSADAAMLDRVGERADVGHPKVHLSRKWGEGRFVVASYSSVEGRRLALGFVLEQRRGWRVIAYTEEAARDKDVGVGSLLVASSDGGTGQPPWSAAAGVISDNDVIKVEIRWASGEVTSAIRHNGAYLVLERGTTTPLEARFLAKDGSEVAKVPIE
jgi:hypothetical protein